METSGPKPYIYNITPPPPKKIINVCFRLTLEKLRSKVRQNLEALESSHNGIVSKSTGYQQILNMISRDIRQQNKRRIQRNGELQSLRKTLKSLSEKGTYLDEQIKSFHDYVQACVNQIANKTQVLLSLSIYILKVLLCIIF